MDNKKIYSFILLIFIVISETVAYTHFPQKISNNIIKKSNQDITGNILHLSDIHFDPYYSVGSPANCLLGSTGLGCCRNYDIPIEPYRNAEKYGDYNCDTPFIFINKTFGLLSNYNFDAIIWTGDTVGHHDFNQSIDQNLNTISEISELFKFHFPNIPIFPCIGNHDTWPIDQMAQPPYNKYFLNQLTEIWNEWITKDSYNTFMTGGYYSKMFGSIKILALNSLYFDSNNLEKDFGNIEPNAQLSWLNTELNNSALINQSVWIIGHVPPGSGEFTQNLTNFVELCDTYSQIIKVNLWGHTHKDAFYLLYFNDKLINYGTMSGSLMPDEHFPVFRIYQYSIFQMKNNCAVNFHGKMWYILL